MDSWLLLGALPMLATLPRGDGHPVLILPGLGASDISTLTLRTILSRLGYAVHGWRLGYNIGPTARVVQGVPMRLEELHARYHRPVTVIGWSLGGLYARRLARSHPELIRQVITLGSPIRLSRYQQSNSHRIYDLLKRLHAEHYSLPLEQGEGPLPVPATSFYSRRDGMVCWQICLDDHGGPQAENIEVRAAHFGFGVHPAVIWALADRLAQSLGRWAPFRPPALMAGAYPRVQWDFSGAQT